MIFALIFKSYKHCLTFHKFDDIDQARRAQKDVDELWLFKFDFDNLTAGVLGRSSMRFTFWI